MSPVRPYLALVLWLLAAAAWLPAAAVAGEAAPKKPAEAAKVAEAVPAKAAKAPEPVPAKVVKAAKATETVPDKGKVATPTEASSLDALEQLRVRITERLAAGPGKAAPGTHDVNAGHRAPAAASRPATATGTGTGTGTGARGARVVPLAAGARKGADSVTAWAYEGAAGPQAWGELKPEFALCAKGQRQSPIDLQGGLSVDLEPVLFHYQASRFAVVDNGHTVQVRVAPGNAIELAGRRYELQYFTFHRPGEGRIDGRQFEMSLHLMHKDAQGRLAVVALLLDPGPPQPVVQQVLNNLPLERNEEAAARVALELPDLLPRDRRYYTYMGSLTTPPCTEGVQWVVMRHPVTASPEQLELFARLHPMNARPLQAAAGRRIMQSN